MRTKVNDKETTMNKTIKTMADKAGELVAVALVAGVLMGLFTVIRLVVGF